MIVASGTSNRHVKALSDAVAEKGEGRRDTGRSASRVPRGVNGFCWTLQDALVHVMLPRVREFYNLEKLWSLRPIDDAMATDR